MLKGYTVRESLGTPVLEYRVKFLRRVLRLRSNFYPLGLVLPAS